MTIMRRCLGSSGRPERGFRQQAPISLGDECVEIKHAGRSPLLDSADSMPTKMRRKASRRGGARHSEGQAAGAIDRDILGVTFAGLWNPMIGKLARRSMEPENEKEKPEKRLEIRRRATQRGADAKVVEGKAAEPRVTPAQIVRPGMTERRFAQVSRRELLKVVPVLALGAFAIPRFQDSLLKKGLGFSDWASEKLFRTRASGADVRRCRGDAVREVSDQRLRRG